MRNLISFSLVFLGLFFAACSVTAQTKQDDYAAEFAKVMPSPLPQSPAVPRVGSDLRDNWIKGRVKTLLEETENLDKTESPADRHRTHESEFGLDGNLITDKLFDYRGNPSMAGVYGYLDGKRVSKMGPSIHHDYDPSPMMAPPGLPKPQSTKGDNRYTSAWEYKYDAAGRIIEKVLYNNRGTVGYRMTFEYGNNTRKVTNCTEPCFTSPRVQIATLDAKGFETKFQYPSGDTPQASDDVTSFKYLAFDSQGNWTKREATGSYHDPSGVTKAIHYIEYRTFTYF
jgi:YD repeat-containing protein